MSDNQRWDVLVVDEREGKQPFFTKIGAMFANRSGNGFTIQLSALPIGGKLIVREPRQREGGNERNDAPRSAGGGNVHDDIPFARIDVVCG